MRRKRLTMPRPNVDAQTDSRAPTRSSMANPDRRDPCLSNAMRNRHQRPTALPMARPVALDGGLADLCVSGHSPKPTTCQRS
jgi:hypothetical protein